MLSFQLPNLLDSMVDCCRFKVLVPSEVEDGRSADAARAGHADETSAA